MFVYAVFFEETRILGGDEKKLCAEEVRLRSVITSIDRIKTLEVLLKDGDPLRTTAHVTGLYLLRTE